MLAVVHREVRECMEHNATRLLLLVACLMIAISLFSGSSQMAADSSTLDELYSLLLPVYSVRESRGLDVKEVLEIRAMYLRSKCRTAARSGRQVYTRRLRTVSPAGGEAPAGPRLTWCGHPATVTDRVRKQLERLRDANAQNDIGLELDDYLSLGTGEHREPGARLASASWHIVQHPLLRLVQTHQDLQHHRPGTEEVRIRLGKLFPTFRDLVQLLADTAPGQGQGQGPLPALLKPISKLCSVCASDFQFVLHAPDLQPEVSFLVSEMQWENTWPSGEGEGELRPLLSEAVLQLGSVPRRLLDRAMQHYQADLEIYGFTWDVDVLYDTLYPREQIVHVASGRTRQEPLQAL